MVRAKDIDSIEVYMRKPCPNYNCNDGYDTAGSSPADTCATCHGFGHIMEWVNLKELLREVIKI